MRKIYNISDYKRKFFKISYKDLSFHNLLYSSLHSFYCIPRDSGDMSPDTWNPILVYGMWGYFDPYMMTGSQAREFTDDSDHKWKPWPGVNGIERTKLFLKHIFPIITSKKRIQTPSPTESVFYKDYITYHHFMYTKEVLSDNEIILSILCNTTKQAKRVHITDLKKVCTLLSWKNFEFPRVFGSSNERIEIEDINYINKKTKLFDFLEDGSNIKIQDENVYEIFKTFSFLDTKVYDINNIS